MLGPSAHIDTFTRDNLPPEEAWPQILLDRPEFQHPEHLNAAVELIDAMVGKGHGVRPAIVSWNESLTYRDLMKASNRIAHVLTAEMGLVPGARVLLRGANNPRMVACQAGVLKAGLVAVATMPLLRAGELKAIVEKGQVEVALCDRRLAEDMQACAADSETMKRIVYFDGSGTGADELEGLMARASPQFEPVATGRDDVALLGFTSGTTGNPKATMHFHRDVLAICDGYAGHVLQPHPEDIFIGSPPIAFTFGLGGLVTFPLRFGASGLLLEDGRPPKLIEAIDRFRPTVVFTAPTAYRAIAEMARADPKRWDLTSLRLCVSAGETLPPAVYDLWMETVGAQILDGIGSTEMLHIFISNHPDTAEPGTTGTPVPGYRAKIVDEAMNDVPVGEPGFLAVKGPTGCRYLADERQARYVRDGWNVTGDVMAMDKDGRFSFVARSDDMIVSSGYNISGPEAENALLSHADVVECAVIGVADEARGEIVQAHVVLKEGVDRGEATVTALQDHVKATIAPYKYPRSIVFTDALPKTQTGKIQRFRLREGGQVEIGPMEMLNPKSWKPAKGYSNGVAAEGKQIFVAGQIGWDENARFQTDDFAGQAEQAMRNVAAVLAEAGAEPRHLVRLTWYVVDKREYLDRLADLGAAYRAVFGRHYPAMTLVQVAALVEERAKVEIEATAVLPSA